MVIDPSSEASRFRWLTRPQQPVLGVGAAPVSYEDVIAQVQGDAGAGAGGLSQILEEIKKIMAAAPVSAPVTEESLVGQQPGLADLIKQLGLDRDWEAEAGRVLAERGMVKPEAPVPQKPGIGVALAALGPALGAIFGGQPAMAAPGAAAALGGYRKGFEEEQARYVTERDKYVEASAALADRMQGRAQQQASMLLPFFAMTAAEQVSARVSAHQLLIAYRGLGFQEKQVALQGAQLGMQAQAREDDLRYRNAMLTLDALKMIDARAAAKLQAELQREQLEEQKRSNAAQEELGRGELGVAWFNARTARMGAAAKGDSYADKLNQLRWNLIVDNLAGAIDPKTGQVVDQKRYDAGVRLAFGVNQAQAPGFTDAEKAVIDQYSTMLNSRVVSDPGQLEAARQRSNAVLRKYGIVEMPPSTPGTIGSVRRVWRWLFGGPAGP